MRKIAMMMLVCAAAFMFIAAPIYMNKEAVHQVFVNNKFFADGVLINGRLAIPVDQFTKAVGGAANVRIQGNKLTIIAPRLQASAPAGSSFTPTAHGSGGGGGAGKVAVHDIHIVKTTDSASPLIVRDGTQFIWFDDVAKFFGATTAINGGTLAPGAPVNVNFAPNPNAALTLTHTP
jgi:type VI secretion system (T6SS) effector Hcp